MNHLILMFLLVVTCFSTPIQRVNPSRYIVSIESWNGNDFSFIGSGSSVDYRGQPAVLTAWHVLQDEQLVRLCHDTRCVIQSSDDFRRVSNRDVGVVYTPIELTDSLDLPSKANVSIGDELYSAGYPSGYSLQFTGEVLSIEGSRAVMNGHCEPGSSGSLILDSKSNIAGVVVAIPIVMGIPDFNLCILELM